MLQECAKLTRPYPVSRCDNADCGAELDRDAYALLDTVERETLVYCDACAESAVKYHADRFKPVSA